VDWKLIHMSCIFGLEFAFGRNKKSKVFGIPSHLLLNKSNGVHSENKTFLAVSNELLLRL
jgi:hypothetical protein